MGGSVPGLPSPRLLLERFGLKPKHSFGQNFLSDPNLQRRIADEIVRGLPTTGVRILEIGAGLGALTWHLLQSGHKVTAVERDRDLILPLSELFANELASGQLTLLEEDAKALDWTTLFQPDELPVLAGNLPYQITGPLLEKAVLFPRPVGRAVFLVQKEVGDRLVARADTDAYGALSVFVQARFEPERALVLKGPAFYPPPRVDSVVVRFLPRPEPISEETAVFRALVKGAFGARRKTLRNAWKALGSAAWMAEACKEANISLDARGETLDVRDFARLARLLEARPEK
jgi:16S rRNA (adenine1518-N6/adenine1519-N6)-dimethyltransferase